MPGSKNQLHRSSSSIKKGVDGVEEGRRWWCQGVTLFNVGAVMMTIKVEISLCDSGMDVKSHTI